VSAIDPLIFLSVSLLLAGGDHRLLDSGGSRLAVDPTVTLHAE
jgi:hypothetical protein